MFQASAKAIQDGLFLVQAGANHERKAELLAVSLVEPLESSDFLGRKFVQPCTRLLGGRGRGQSACQRRPTHQVGVRADQRELLFLARFLHGLAKRDWKSK